MRRPRPYGIGRGGREGGREGGRGGKEGGIVSEEGWLSEWVMEGGKEGGRKGGEGKRCSYMYICVHVYT